MDLLLFYSQVPCYEGKESAAMKELFKVLKDHKKPHDSGISKLFV